LLLAERQYKGNVIKGEQREIKKINNNNKGHQIYKPHGSPDLNDDQMRKYLKNNPSCSVLVSGKAQLNNINKKH